MGKRIISGVVIVAMLVGLLILQGVYLKIGVVLIGLFCQYEMLHTIRQGGTKTMDVPVYAAALALFPAYYFWGASGVLYVYALALMALFMTRTLCDAYDYRSVAYSALSLLYPQLFMVFFYKIVCVADEAVSLRMIVFSIMAASSSDTFAYFVGRAMGKRKLCPAISPNKTVEGAVGGLLGGTVMTGLTALVFGETALPLYAYFLLGAVLAALSQFGDLASSLTKRFFGVKDFGKLIPGHGGMLDRVCSNIIVLQVSFLFFKLFSGI